MGVQAEPQHGDARDAALAAHEPAIAGRSSIGAIPTAISARTGRIETYSRLNPPYQCKNSFFESVEELRLVYGADPPRFFTVMTTIGMEFSISTRTTRICRRRMTTATVLDSGILDFLTVFTREPNTRTNSSPRINVNSADAAELTQMLRKSSARRKPHPQDSISGRRHEIRQVCSSFTSEPDDRR